MFIMDTQVVCNYEAMLNEIKPNASYPHVAIITCQTDYIVYVNTHWCVLLGSLITRNIARACNSRCENIPTRYGQSTLAGSILNAFTMYVR